MKRKKSKMISVVICLSVFAMFALGSGSGSSSTPTKVGEISSGSSIGTSQEKTSAEEEKAEYHVGDTYSKDGLSIVYVSSSNYKSSNQFNQPKEGKKYIRMAFHVDNQSGSDKTVSVYSFNCYADGYECSAEYEDDSISVSLSNGRSGDGAVYFEVPEDAVNIDVEYEVNAFSSKKIKFIFDGDKESGMFFDSNTNVSANAFHVGDIIETTKLKMQYIKAAEYVSDNQFLQPKEGMKYVYIELEVENISDSDCSVSYYLFDCYADGTECDGFYGMDDALSAKLSAGRKAKGTIAFEVPIDAKVIEFEYEDNVWTGNKVIFLYE